MGRLSIALLIIVISLTGSILICCAGPSENTAKLHFDEGNELYEQGRLNEAIAEYTEAISINPEYVNAYNNRGLAYTDLGAFQSGIDDFSEAIRLNPKYANAYLNRGLAYKLQGKKTEALADFQIVISLTDRDDLIEKAVEMIAELSQKTSYNYSPYTLSQGHVIIMIP